MAQLSPPSQSECVVFKLHPPFPSSVEERYEWDLLRRPDYGPQTVEDTDARSTSDPVELSDDLARGMPALHIDTDTDSMVSYSELSTPTTQEEALPNIARTSHEKDGPEGGLEGSGRYRAPHDRPRRGVPRRAVTTLTSAPINVAKVPKTQGYVLLLRIKTRNGDEDFQLLADTGSNLSFVFAEGYAQIDMNLERVDWGQDIGQYPRHEQLYVPGLDGRASLDTLRSRFGQIVSVSYKDGCQADCVIPRQGAQCSLGCYDWRSGALHDLRVIAYLAAAFAVNDKLVKDPTDGILALGTSLFQEGYTMDHGGPKYMSFMHSLMTQLKRSPNSSRENYAMYLTIRPHPGYYPNLTTTSWLSFNEWPFESSPRFSRDIYLDDHAYGAGKHRWSVTLRRMEFLRNSGNDANAHFHGGDIRFDHGGLEVILDSGSSLSWLPRFMIEKLHYEVFGNEQAIIGDSQDRKTYTVGTHFPPDVGQIRYTFASNMRGQPDIVVQAPMNHFVFERELSTEGGPLIGMIYEGRNNYGVFGLNFMQTMYLSFHHGNSGRSWVKMAPQMPEDRELYQLMQDH